MPGYLIADVNVHDPERFSGYSSETPKLIEAHKGRYLVRGGEVDALEMETPPSRLVVVEFPSLEAARAYYHSDEYTRLRSIRQASATSSLLLVDGYSA